MIFYKGGTGFDGAWILAKDLDGDICILGHDLTYTPEEDDVLVLMFWSSDDVLFDYPLCAIIDEGLPYVSENRELQDNGSVFGSVRIDVEHERAGVKTLFSSCVDFVDQGWYLLIIHTNCIVSRKRKHQ